MTDITRRDLMAGLVAVPAALAIPQEMLQRAADHAHGVHEAEEQAAQGAAAQQPVAYVPKNFTSDEWRLVRLLVNYVIPRDARSGSATDARVPEFMDFIMGEYRNSQTWMKNGLTWMNAECRRRYGKTFVSCSEEERRAVLDAIAFPKKARAEDKPGVDFFNNFRNLTASGFWTSRIGIADLGYIGNRPVMTWEGTPANVQRWLGI